MKRFLTALFCFGLLFSIAGTSEAVGQKSAEYFNLLAGGTFHLKAKTAGEQGKFSISDTVIFAKDGNAAETTDYIRVIFKNNRMYTIMDAQKMIMVVETTESPIYALLAAGMVYTGSGSAVFDMRQGQAVSGQFVRIGDDGSPIFDGNKLPYEEYTNKKDGNKIQFFFDGNKLVGIRTIDKQNTSVYMKILALDKNVPANAFDIPTGYKTSENYTR